MDAEAKADRDALAEHIRQAEKREDEIVRRIELLTGGIHAP